MKRLLIFIYSANSYSETFIADEVDFLKRLQSVRTTVLHYGEPKKSKAVEGLNIPNNFLFRWLKSPAKLNLKALKFANGRKSLLQYLIPLFEKTGFDVIYCHFGPNGKLIAELMQLGYVSSESRLIVRFHGMDLVKGKYDANYYKILTQHVHTYIVGTEYAKTQLQGYNVPQSKIVILPVGVKERNIVTELKCKQFGTTWHLISIGRLVELKGHIQAIEIMKILKDSRIQFKYTIVGSGPLQKDLLKLLDTYNLMSLVTIVPPLNHASTLKLLQQNDIYIYTGIRDKVGREETQGLANIEAMAAGLPIISSPVGGIPSYVVNNYTGFLYDSKNPEMFAEKIKWLMDNYSSRLVSDIRQNAINLVRSHYQQELLNEELLKIIR